MTGHRLGDALTAGLVYRAPAWFGAGTVLLDGGKGACFTISVRGERVTVRPGRAGRPTTVLQGSADDLADLVAGRASAVDLGLAGRVVARGDVALSLRLCALLTTPAPERAGSVRALGVDTAYLEAGSSPPDGAETVVLLHGLGATGSSLLPTLSALRSSYRVIVVDLPGHGGSSSVRRRHDAVFLAGWLQAVLDGLGLERVHLLGNSLGGRIAIETGLCAPERVGSLVLYCPSVAFLRRRAYVPLARLARQEAGLLPLRLPRWQAETSIRLMMARPERLDHAQLDAAVDESLRVFRSRAGRYAYLSAMREIYLEPARGPRGFWDRLGGLEPRSLFVWGARDRYVPPGFARHVRAALPAATSVVLDDCGHIPQWEVPQRVHPLTMSFLRGEPVASVERAPRVRTAGSPV